MAMTLEPEFFAIFAIFANFAAAAAARCGLATFGGSDSGPLNLAALPVHRSLIDDTIESTPTKVERAVADGKGEHD